MFDWHQFHRDVAHKTALVDPRRRARICLLAFGVLAVVIFFRAVQLEWSYGAAYRAEAMRPVEKVRIVRGIRGKIKARDGTVLACDKELSSLAVRYSDLQNPPDPKWLKAAARARLSKANRGKPAKVAEEQQRVLAERDELSHRLAKLCNMTGEEWSARAERIQSRVAKIAASANARQAEKIEESNEPEDESWSAWIVRSLKEPQPPAKIAVAEELDYHVMCDDPPAAALAEIERQPKKFPGVKIVKQTRRFYPQGKTAANVLGYLGLAGEERDYHSDDWAGKLGIEKSCETILRGRRGEAVDIVRRGGRIVSSSYRQTPETGSDVTLTLDPALQQSAEELLDSVMERRKLSRTEIASAGGAIVVMEIADGSLRALAAAPRYDPNLFVSERSGEIAALLDDPARPLIDRTCRMAVAPGSVFKILTAVALLESGGIDPEEPFFCQGYLNKPEERRCAIFVKQGIGHGETTLADALCVSCNVYFFHHAGRLGPDPLVEWADRFGFGHPTGVDLPGEAAGVVPNPANIERLEHHAWKTADTQALSVGQSSLTVTPLQVACMTAAIAGDGSLVKPHVVESRAGSAHQNDKSDHQADELMVGEAHPTKIPDLHEKTLRVIREGLERVVSDAAGTAHGSVYLEEVPIAGKTGTAETGDGASHAWFAGYVPADKPKYVFVIALEHAGEAAASAGPVAKRLVLRMKQLGMFY